MAAAPPASQVAVSVTTRPEGVRDSNLTPVASRGWGDPLRLGDRHFPARRVDRRDRGVLFRSDHLEGELVRAEPRRRTICHQLQRAPMCRARLDVDGDEIQGRASPDRQGRWRAFCRRATGRSPTERRPAACRRSVAATLAPGRPSERRTRGIGRSPAQQRSGRSPPSRPGPRPARGDGASSPVGLVTISRPDAATTRPAMLSSLARLATGRQHKGQQRSHADCAVGPAPGDGASATPAGDGAAGGCSFDDVPTDQPGVAGIDPELDEPQPLGRAGRWPRTGRPRRGGASRPVRPGRSGAHVSFGATQASSVATTRSVRSLPNRRRRQARRPCGRAPAASDAPAPAAERPLCPGEGVERAVGPERDPDAVAANGHAADHARPRDGPAAGTGGARDDRAAGGRPGRPPGRPPWPTRACGIATDRATAPPAASRGRSPSRPRPSGSNRAIETSRPVASSETTSS